MSTIRSYRMILRNIATVYLAITGTLHVCGVCHRSGADHLLGRVSKAMLPKRYREPADGLTGGKGKSKGGRTKARRRGKPVEPMAVAG